KVIDILRSLPADQMVTLSATQSKLTLVGGKSRFTLQTMPADDFPLVQESADFGPMFSVPQKTLRNLISQVHFAMAVHDIRYYLNGILFIAEGRMLTLVATDGHRLAVAASTLDLHLPRRGPPAGEGAVDARHRRPQPAGGDPAAQDRPRAAAPAEGRRVADRDA